jgi:two-component system response regulator YesN
LTRDEIAGYVHLNADYLNRVFQKVCGASIIEYVNCRKIENAKSLLKKTDMLISDISKKVGYDNFSNFSTIFKKKVGATPSQYRSSIC